MVATYVDCMYTVSCYLCVYIYRLKEILGTGEFGDVFKGEWETPYGVKEIAAKLLRKGAEQDDVVKFLQEAAIMAQFKHPNVVGFFGAVTLQQPVRTFVNVCKRPLNTLC